MREAFDLYAQRLGGGFRLDLTEVPAGRRRGREAPAEEGDRLLRGVPEGARLVTLDEGGEPWTTRCFAERLERWRHEGRPLALAVGGADGLSTAVHAAAEASWSLSPLTLPHQLVRVIVAEQVYRAFTILNGHPYHRG